MKIMVNCGHGRSSDGTFDPGCVYGDYSEAALMLPITKSAVKHLRNQGITVLSDADTNNNKNIIADVAWANREKVALYVSIHCDTYKAKTGVMPLYVSADGKKLAQALDSAISSGMHIKSRKVQKRTDLYELNATDMPSCILETGSIKADLSVFGKSDEYGECIARGICSYLGMKYKENTVEYGKMLKYKAVYKANIYKDHSIGSAKLGQVNVGSVYTATQWYRDDWCYIPYLKGWVPIKGNMNGKPTVYLEPHNILYTVVNASGVNVYEDHTTKSKYLKNVPKGTHCTATMWYGKWAYIPYQGGWVAMSCLHEGGRAQALLYECSIIGKKMADNNFTYSKENLKSTFAAALKSDHRTDCAHYVSYAMQAIDLLPSGATIWLDTGINGTKKGVAYVKNSGKFSISYPNKIPKYCNLKPGDICGWGYVINGKHGQHTMVFAGIKDGKYMWYSAGGSDVKGKNYGEKEKPTFMERRVNVLLRAK